MNQTQSFSLFLVALLILGSCSKFDDGPALSLLPAKARLTGSWEVVDFTGQAAPDLLQQLEEGTSLTLEFDRGGEGNVVDTYPLYDYYFDYQTYQYTQVLIGMTTNSYSMEWELDEEILEMKLYEDGALFDYVEWEITRLTNSELEMTQKYSPIATYIFEKN